MVEPTGAAMLKLRRADKIARENRMMMTHGRANSEKRKRRETSNVIRLVKSYQAWLAENSCNL